MECISVKPEKKRRTLFEGISLSVHTENEKQHRMTTRHDQISKTPMLDLRSRSVVRDNKRKNLSDIKKSEAKYVRMEDRSNHFERDFHLRRLSGKYIKSIFVFLLFISFIIISFTLVLIYFKLISTNFVI